MTKPLTGEDLDKIERGMMFYCQYETALITNTAFSNQEFPLQGIVLETGRIFESPLSGFDQCKYLGRAVLSKYIPAGTPFEEVMKSFKGEM